MKQEMMGGRLAVTSAEVEPYADHPHLAPDR